MFSTPLNIFHFDYFCLLSYSHSSQTKKKKKYTIVNTDELCGSRDMAAKESISQPQDSVGFYSLKLAVGYLCTYMLGMFEDSHTSGRFFLAPVSVTYSLLFSRS